MCTLSYIPTLDGFIWTHNRDESPKRVAEKLVQKKQLLYPEDPISKGSWISMSADETIISILNGAWDRQVYEVSKVRSRGLVLLDFFEYKDVHHFYEKYNFEGIQPFTMIIYSQGELWDLRWDKSKKGLIKKDATQSHIWSSAMLYSAEIRQKRKEWFADFIQKKEHNTKQAILNFHQYAGDGDKPNDLIMQREFVQTVSITSIVKNRADLSLNYWDLAANQQQFGLLNL